MPLTSLALLMLTLVGMLKNVICYANIITYHSK